MEKLIKHILTYLLHFFWIFRIRKNAIVISFFQGSAVGGDCKAIVDYSNNNNLGYKFYWIINKSFKKEKYNIPNLKFIKKGSLTFYFRLLTSKTIFSNINPISFIPYRKKQTLINSWHGYGFKVFKVDKKNTRESITKHFNMNNAFLSCNRFATEKIVRGSFEFKNEVLEIGSPKNDLFFNKEAVQAAERKVRLFCRISDDTKTVLFAPTFRADFSYDEESLDFLKLKQSLETKFGGNWVVLFRMHPMLAAKCNIKSDFIIDVSGYDDMQELLATADVLITDYSSSMWDFTIQNKPVLVYAPDIKQYMEEDRGFYVPVDEWPYPVAKSNDELRDAISKFDLKKYHESLSDFILKVGNFETGNACKKVFEYIKEKGEK